MVLLEVVSGCSADRGRKWEYREYDHAVFGRAYDCGGRFSDDEGNKDDRISRRHFILEVNPPEARIRDFGSLHRTYVNDLPTGGRQPDQTPEEGQRVQHPEVDLRDGDVIRIGDGTEIAVRISAVCANDDCGREIADSLRGHLCPRCVAERLNSDNDSLPAPVECGVCGRDVTDEAAGRRGDYVCRTCRSERERRAKRAIERQFNGRMDDSSASDAPEVPGLHIERELSRGGQGVVYLARDADGKALAVKTMLAKIAVDERARARFQREIEVMCEFRHPHITALLDHGSLGATFYFVMEYCQGGSLLDAMKSKRRPFLLDEAIPYMLQVMDAMAYAHEQDYVHRDLKPGNILLSGTLGSFIAKVTDFGLARKFQGAGLSGMAITRTGDRGGTMAFMPREQLVNFKYVNPVSDVWSLAATFYYLLTQQYAREFGAHPVVEDVANKPVVPLRQRDLSIPPQVATVFDRALEDDAEKRYQTAGEFRDALSRVL